MVRIKGKIEINQKFIEKQQKNIRKKDETREGKIFPFHLFLCHTFFFNPNFP